LILTKLNHHYVYLIPSLSLYVFFLVVPIFGSFWISFHKFDPLSPMEWVGLANYEEISRDRIVPIAYTNVTIWTIIATAPVLISLVLACMLNEEIRGRAIFETLICLPIVLSGAATGFIFKFVFQRDWGLLNTILGSIGLAQLQRAWLGVPQLVIYMCMLAGDWGYIPYCTILFLAAVRSIPRDLYEAAKIDGAGGLTAFRYITLPMLKRAFAVIMIITIVFSLRVFDIIYVITRTGRNPFTETPATYIYDRSFKVYRFGYGSAMAVLLFIITFAVSQIYLKLNK